MPERVDRTAVLAMQREEMADIILQVVEDDSNRIDCRVDGYKYLIGRTRLGYGIALVWDPSKVNKDRQVLTRAILENILDEAEAAKASQPVYIYASGSTAPLSDDLYRFHQIPDAILIMYMLAPRLNKIGFNDAFGIGEE